CLFSHQQAMDEISKFIATGDQIFLDKGIEILKNAGMMLRSSYTRYADEKISNYPTRSGEANLVLLAIEEFKKGNIEEEQMDVILLGFEDHIEGTRKEFEELCLHEVDSILIQEEIPRAIDAFDKIDAACTEIREFFAGADPSHLDNGAEMLKSAVTELAASYDTFESIEERSSKRVCFKCSAENPVEAKVCTNCGAVLPKMFDDTVQSTFQISETREIEFGGGFVMTENIDKILDAANCMADGVITADEFLDTIKWMEVILARASLDLAVMKNPPMNEEETEAIENQKNLLCEGIRIIGEGLAEMKLYPDDPDKNHLIEGAKILWQGAREIQEILKLTEELPPSGF
ncbi:MAG: hypothetical protein M1536_05430, partial [Firmicutes bacterium]|nr:hypothetical protein [Bacillota bacterium]